LYSFSSQYNFTYSFNYVTARILVLLQVTLQTRGKDFWTSNSPQMGRGPIAPNFSLLGRGQWIAAYMYGAALPLAQTNQLPLPRL